MKVSLKKLPFKKKVYEIKSTVRNMKATYQLQVMFAENSDLDNKEDLEIVESLSASLDAAVGYIQKVLKLDDSDIETIEDELTQEEVFDVANTIALKLLGIDPKELEDSKK